MKFLGDMGISPRTISLLRERGYDAIHLVEQNLERMPDPILICVSPNNIGFGLLNSLLFQNGKLVNFDHTNFMITHAHSKSNLLYGRESRC